MITVFLGDLVVVVDDNDLQLGSLLMFHTLKKNLIMQLAKKEGPFLYPLRMEYGNRLKLTTCLDCHMNQSLGGSAALGLNLILKMV